MLLILVQLMLLIVSLILTKYTNHATILTNNININNNNNNVNGVDFGNVALSGQNYSCDELIRWIGTEKHYSNDKKEILFAMLSKDNKLKEDECKKAPVIFLNRVRFGYSNSGKRSFYQVNAGGQSSPKSYPQCGLHDDYAIAYLSNFSINNNFSHFLHGLLRLFCALIDSRWLMWDAKALKFVATVNYTIWLDEYFKVSDAKLTWIKALGGNIRHMGKDLTAKGSCISSKVLLYGSGCVRLLPPEKWFGYPGCRAQIVLPAFGYHMRQHFSAASQDSLYTVDAPVGGGRSIGGLRVAFAVRDASALTGKREISNLGQVQAMLKMTQHVRVSTENVTFEHLDVPSTVRYMAGVHIFVSVHGAGMTNMFFMNPGSAVVEIIPHPLCNCRSPDYFYGEGGYYHGSSIAQGILHYTYCAPPQDTHWHEKPNDLRPGGKCSWKHLHAVESVFVEPTRFVSVMRKVERDLVAIGTILLTKPIINMGPHANGR